MISASNVLVQLEEFIPQNQSGGGFLEIWKNPTQQEFLGLLNKSNSDNIPNLFMFVADAKSKTIYVWNGTLVRYNEVKEIFNFPEYSDLKRPYICNGIFVINSRGIASIQTLENIDNLVKSLINLDRGEYKKVVKYLTEFFSYNWTWLDTYIQKTSLLMKMYFYPLFKKNQVY